MGRATLGGAGCWPLPAQLTLSRDTVGDQTGAPTCKTLQPPEPILVILNQKPLSGEGGTQGV